MPTWQMAAVVFAAALTIRAAHVLSLRDAPFFTHLLGDAEGYDLWARRLAGGDWLGRGSGVFYQAPLYPYAIGSFYADDRKIRSVLHWQPTVDLREGLSRTLHFYREHRADYWGEEPDHDAISVLLPLRQR